jgi:hypothetical protein
MDRLDQAQQYLIHSLLENPFLWNAWQELGKTIENISMVTHSLKEIDKCLKQLPTTLGSECFRVYVFQN